MKTPSYYIPLIVLLLSGSVFFYSCKKIEENPQPPTNESEILTTLKLTFTDSSGTSSPVSAVFRDTDGDGGNAPVQFDTILLQAQKTYFAEVQILDETKNPADTISIEIKEESSDHLFFYMVSGGLNLSITITDEDTNNPPLPLGLNSTWRAGMTGTGTTRIVLRHQPGVKDGTFSPGETDVDLTFQAIIQ